MKRTSAVLALNLLFLAVTPLFAESKIGYVDIDRVTNKAKQVKGIMDAVQTKVTGIQKEIETKRNQINDLQADLKRTEGVLEKGEQEKKNKELQRLKNELDDLDYNARREMQKYDDTEFTPLLKKITYTIQDVAKERHFDLVVRGEAVLYGTPAVDITDDVIHKLNSEDAGTSGVRTAEATTPESPAPTEAPGEKTATAKAAPAESAESTEAKPKPTRSASGNSAKAAATPHTDAPRPVDRQKD